MLGSLATTLCFAVTPIFAHRATHRLGSISANLWRLVLAAVVLGIWAHLFGQGVETTARTWFFLGGISGFGVGGVAMFLSLPRLGSNLSTLLVQCGSAIVAVFVERLWLGTALAPLQLAAVTLTLTGVMIGLMPRSLARVSPGQFRAGVAWALLSAAGQGVGAVLSRKAFAAAAMFHEHVDPGTAAYLRVLGGLLVALLALAAISFRSHHDLPRGRAWSWVAANALTGPILGVACYQWALRTTPAGLVQSVVATAPLFTVPLALWIEKAPRPSPTYYAGCILAIAGAAVIALAR